VGRAVPDAGNESPEGLETPLHPVCRSGGTWPAINPVGLHCPGEAFDEATGQASL
jgi:hypothetical protein